MADTDPWRWSVDELVAQVCHSHTLFNTAGEYTNIPPGPALEKEIRARNMTGKEFLTTIDSRALILRNEFKIPHLIQRLALWSVIGMLRERPSIHNQHNLTTSVQPPDNNITKASPALDVDACLHDRSSPHDTPNLHGAGRRRKKVELVSMEPLQRAQAGADADADVDVDEFSHLLRWHDPDVEDNIIDFAWQDDPEEEHAAEDDPELSEDSEEEPPSRTTLTVDEIVEIINERIAFYSESWRPNAGVPRGEEVVYDVDAMWDEAEASGKRQHLLQQHETDYAYYSNRLDKLCDEIVQSPGSNAVSNTAYTLPLNLI